MVVIAIMTYAAMTLWPRIKYKTGQAKLRKLQTLTCLGIMGATERIPTAATEVLLGLPHLHLRYRLKSGKESIASTAVNSQNPKLCGMDT
jgi:hypothetical protein